MDLLKKDVCIRLIISFKTLIIIIFSNRGFLSIYQMYRSVVYLKLYFKQKGKPNWTPLWKFDWFIIIKFFLNFIIILCDFFNKGFVNGNGLGRWKYGKFKYKIYTST